MTEEQARQLLIDTVGRSRVAEVASEHWIAAAVLGGLRQACNDALRAKHRDRGSEKNAAGDVQGCFGELLVGALIEAEIPQATVTATPLDWDKPGDEVDATVEIDQHRFLVETKCHLHEPAKRRYLINAVAAQRSQERGARSFVPIFSALGAGLALIGKPLLLRDVLSWPSEEFGYGDPALSAKLVMLVPQQFELSFPDAVRRISDSGEVVAPDELRAVAARARRNFSQLRERNLRLDEGPLATVRTLVSVA